MPEVPDDAGRYRGLVYGRMAPTAFASDALIQRGSGGHAEPDGEQPGGGASPGIDPKPTESNRPARFFGSVELDSARPIRSFESFFNAVVALFQNANGAKVKLTLEIEAEAPGGFSDADVRDIRDYSKKLKFRSESTGFE